MGGQNSLTDVPGVRVGQSERVGAGWLTGTTVVLPPPEGGVAGVDVRGGGPGTRETDLLDPRNIVERVHAIVLTGGSALGLAAADGVAQRLLRDGIGFPMGGPGEVVPIVPGAVIYDLGRGGVFAHHPDAAFGEAAYDAASTEVSLGNHGAGTGATVGGLKGGVGTASAVLGMGTTVGALAVVNAVGSSVDPTTGELYAAHYCAPGDLPALRRPDHAEVAAAKERAAEQATPLKPPLATTLVVLATAATLVEAVRRWRSGTTAWPGHRPGAHDLDGDTASPWPRAPARLRTRSPSTHCWRPPAPVSPVRSPAPYSPRSPPMTSAATATHSPRRSPSPAVEVRAERASKPGKRCRASIGVHALRLLRGFEARP